MAAIAPVQYRPHDADYGLGIEVVDAGELRARVAADPARGLERVDFLAVLHVRGGSYRHVVDFDAYELGPGSCLTIMPGQVHRFGPPSDWVGWMLVVSPHLVPAAIRSVPIHLVLSVAASEAVAEWFARVEADTRSPADPSQLGALLALQTHVFAARLALEGGEGAERATGGLVDAGLVARYRDYREAVERSFRSRHLVAPYAREIGCSTRTLNRACHAVGGVPAKQVIVDRLLLESKRLLAHVDDPVATVGRQLGFDEATNFVKFFRRRTGTTPAAFRASVR